MPISKDIFGITQGNETVERYTLSNNNNIQVKILTFGGCIQSILVPDKSGNVEDITTGYDSIAEYEKNPAYFGALIGRWANRIHKGRFEVDGVEYNVAVNNDCNHLHGGIVGWDKKVWSANVDGEKLVLQYVSPDGEENYPGQVNVTVTYQLNEDNELLIHYVATTDKATPINLTNHAYFNLNGHKAADIYDQVVQINASEYTPKTEDSVPSGQIASLEGTLYNLQQPTSLGERIPQILADNVGFDMNYCVKGEGDKKLAARVEHAASGRALEVFTNMPGIQLYTANFLDGEPGKDGAKYGKHSCFALETQNYPDAINKPNFPNSILRPGETYVHKCWYKFLTSN